MKAMGSKDGKFGWSIALVKAETFHLTFMEIILAEGLVFMALGKLTIQIHAN